MRCYLVKTPACVMYVGTNAEVAALKRESIKNGCKRSDISITEVDVPTAKADLLKFINSILTAVKQSNNQV